MKKITTLLIFSFLMIGLIACDKGEFPCMKYFKIEGSDHTVDIAPLSNYPAIMDTLTKYNFLQVFRIVDDEYLIGAHCNIFYQGIKLLNDGYSIFLDKSTGEVIEMGYIIHKMSISPVAKISHRDAIEIAKKKMQFKKSCIYYELGIYNVNHNPQLPEEYKLVWKIQNEIGSAYAIIDAKDGEVILIVDDKIY